MAGSQPTEDLGPIRAADRIVDPDVSPEEVIERLLSNDLSALDSREQERPVEVREKEGDRPAPRDSQGRFIRRVMGDDPDTRPRVGEPDYEDLIREREELEREARREPARGEEEGDDRGEGDDREGRREEDDKPKGEEEPEGDIETLSQLAEEFEVEPDELNRLLKVEVGDEKIPLADVLDAYRAAPGAARRQHELDNEFAAFEERRSALQKREEEQVQRLASLVDENIRVLEEETPDWNALREDNPNEYDRQRRLHDRRREVIARALGELRDYDTMRTTEMTEDEKRDRTTQAEKVFAYKPEWRNATTGQPTKAGDEAAKQIEDYFVELGLTKEQINSVFHSALVIGAWEGSEYRRLMNKVKLAQKRVRETPRQTVTSRRGSGVRDGDGKRGASRNLRRRLARTGSDADAAALMAEVMDL